MIDLSEMRKLSGHTRMIGRAPSGPAADAIEDMADEIERLRVCMAAALNATPDQPGEGEGWDIVRDVQKILCAGFRGEKLEP